MTGVTDVINDLLDTFPNTVHIMLNIEPQIENIVLHFYKKIQYMKWSKLFLIDLTLMLNVCLCLLLW